MIILMALWKDSPSFQSSRRWSQNSLSWLWWGPLPVSSQLKRYSMEQCLRLSSFTNHPLISSKLVFYFPWLTHGKKQRPLQRLLMNRLQLPSRRESLTDFNILFPSFYFFQNIFRNRIRGKLVSNQAFWKNEKVWRNELKEYLFLDLRKNISEILSSIGWTNFQI